MKVIDIARSLDGVPEALRSAAQTVRDTRSTGREIEKVAARERIRRAIASDDGVEEDILAALDGGDSLEKLAGRVAPREPLGRVRDDDHQPSGRDTRDALYLERLRGAY